MCLIPKISSIPYFNEQKGRIVSILLSSEVLRKYMGYNNIDVGTSLYSFTMRSMPTGKILMKRQRYVSSSRYKSFIIISCCPI